MLLSPGWCYSSTSSKNHFHEKIPNAVFHPTLPTPFKGEGEQRWHQQLQRNAGGGSEGYSRGCDFSTEKPMDCARRNCLPCCIHSCLVEGGGEGGRREGALRFHHPFRISENTVTGQHRHLVTEVRITA